MLCPWSRACKKCKEHFPITEFSFRKDTQKYRFFCKKCRTLSNKEYFLKNPDKHKEKIIKQKIYYQKNREIIIAKKTKRRPKTSKLNKIYRFKNKEMLEEKRKIFYEKNRERICARVRFLRNQPSRKEEINKYQRERRITGGERMNRLNRERYARNRDKFRLYAKEWNKKHKKRLSQFRKEKRKDINHRMKEVLRCRIRAAIARMAIYNHKYKYTSSINLLGDSIPNVIKYLEKQFKPGMTWQNHGRDGWHIDHIIPCASFDLTDPEQQKKCFHYTNLQPLEAIENIKKGAKIISGDITSPKM